jgi:hypothetical protein
MADYTTELDCVRTFLLAVHTVATTKHSPVEATNLSGITDASFQRILVHPPELMGSDGAGFCWKRFKIEIEEVGEVGLMTAINNILIGIDKFNRRAAITGWVYASAPKMCHLKYANGSQVEGIVKSNNWQCVIWLDVEWSTS